MVEVPDNYVLACDVCLPDKLYLPDLNTTVGVIAGHFEAEHPEHVSDDGTPHPQMRLMWTGPGPAPRPDDTT